MELNTPPVKFSSALAKLAKLITKYHDVINVCMVDFVTKNVFDNVLNNELKENLRQLTESEICYLPEKFFGQNSINMSNKQELDNLINELQQHTLESLCVVECKENLLNQLDSFKNAHSGTSLKHFDKFMSEKKMHEVEVMSELISHLSDENSVDTLIDLGSGKAYLSQVLSATSENLRILAIDSSKTNSEGAQKRSDRLDTKWDGLKKRADFRASGLEPPVRSKHARSKKKEENDNTLPRDSPEQTKRNRFADNLKYVTKFVDIQTDLQSLLIENFSSDEKDFVKFDGNRLGLIGLHTCGNLASDSIKIWINNSTMKFLCNVGCCYHHLDEEFYRNPYLAKEQIDNSVPSFPLSKQLKSMNYQLGRSARMVAAQPMDRLRAKQNLPSEALLWRAILQHILLIHVPDLHFANQQVGRIAAKCATFLDYVKKAFKKLEIDLSMNDAEIEAIYKNFTEKHRNDLNAFYQLRALFGPLIEGLILLDRIVYLFEYSCTSEAYLLQLFDPVISPRCYGIVAWK